MLKAQYFNYTHNQTLRTTGSVIITDFSIVVSLLGGERETTFTALTKPTGRADFCITTVQVGEHLGRSLGIKVCQKTLLAEYKKWVYDLPPEAQQIINSVEFIYE